MTIIHKIMLMKDDSCQEYSLLDAITFTMGKHLVGEYTGSSAVEKAKVHTYKNRIECNGKFIYRGKKKWFKGKFSFCIYHCGTTGDGEPCYLLDTAEIDFSLEEI